MARNLSFSYSKMGMYKECPQKYKFRYVHMLPEKPKYYFAFGTALHAVMEFIFDPAKLAFPSLNQALQFFDITWNKTSFEQKGYASVAKELEGYSEGRRIIEAYYAANEATFVHPLSTEMKSTLEIDGLSLISILDRVDYLGDGKIKILDYKTGKTVQREPDQLYMYQKVVESSPVVRQLVQTKEPGVKEIRVEQLSFYHLPTLHEMTFERAADKEIFEFWKGVLQIADKIRAGKFEPTPGENQCRWCDYRNLCPVFTGKEYNGLAQQVSPKSAKAVTSQPSQAPKNPQEQLSEKIDRCGELEEEIKKLREEIISLLKQNHFQRHFGQKYQAELSEKERLEFTDKAKVITLLRKLQLLSKVLVPTQTTIEQLLQDPSVDQTAKEQLRALASTVQTETLLLHKTDD